MCHYAGPPVTKRTGTNSANAVPRYLSMCASRFTFLLVTIYFCYMGFRLPSSQRERRELRFVVPSERAENTAWEIAMRTR